MFAPLDGGTFLKSAISAFDRQRAAESTLAGPGGLQRFCSGTTGLSYLLMVSQRTTSADPSNWSCCHHIWAGIRGRQRQPLWLMCLLPPSSLSHSQVLVFIPGLLKVPAAWSQCGFCLLELMDSCSSDRCDGSAGTTFLSLIMA